MAKVYVETTVIGAIAGRVRRDLRIRARQLASREWWEEAPGWFELLTSDLVVEECAAGDPNAAAERLVLIKETRQLEVTDTARGLAEALIDRGAIPRTEPRDALHIAVAAVNGVEYLATWNFKHIANATRRADIELACRISGFEPPAICTPDELNKRNS